MLRRKWILGLAITIAAAATGAEWSQEPPAKPASAPISAQDASFPQIASDVARAVELNRVANSHDEWRLSGFTPEDVLSNVRALGDEKALSALCAALSALPDADKALFEEAIEGNRPGLPCAAELLSGIGRHWSDTRSRFQKEWIASGRARFWALGGDGGKPGIGLEPKAPLERIEVTVDADAGPTLVDGGLEPGQIAITLDDGPHPTRTARILDLFRREGVRATYFMVGRNAREFPGLAERAAAEGHVVGSHSWSHRNLPTLSVRAAEDEIVGGTDAVAAAAGVTVPFFRFPYGASTPALRRFVRDRGLAAFLWNMDSLDWKLRDASELYARVVRQLDRAKGGIFLFHDIHEQTVIVLPRLLEELRARGYATVVFIPK